MTNVTISRRSAITGLVGATSAGGIAGAASRLKPDAVPLPVREIVTASTLGIVGDGSSKDTDRAQRALETAAREFRTIHFVGQQEWRFGTSLTVFGSEDRGSTVLLGEGAYSTILRCTNDLVPAFVTDKSEPDFRRLSLRGLTIRGGSQGLSIRRDRDDVASLLDLSDVRFEYQRDVGIHCDQYLISSSFADVVFYYCNRGVYCGRNANNLLFQKARFEGLNDRAVEFASPGQGINGCEDVRFASCRFEGRNGERRPDAFVIGGYRLSTLSVEGGYFEDTHRTILRERGGLGQISFRSCHFSGQAAQASTLQSEIFVSDALVEIHGSRFIRQTEGPRHVLLSGVNRGIKRKDGWYSEFGQTMRYATPVRRPGAGEALTFIGWTNWSAPEERAGAMLVGTLTVLPFATDAAQLRFELLVVGDSSGVLNARLRPSGEMPTGLRATVSRVREGLILKLSGWPAATPAMVQVEGAIRAPGEPPFLLQ